jgi:hypothetical protein
MEAVKQGSCAVGLVVSSRAVHAHQAQLASTAKPGRLLNIDVACHFTLSSSCCCDAVWSFGKQQVVQ